MSRKAPKAFAGRVKRSPRIAVFAARFNQKIVNELLKACIARLTELGVKKSNIEIHHVPGAFELPLAAKWAANSEKFSAIICLGAVIRGETSHFDFVAGECARGIQQVALETGLPIIFGVLTTDNEKQARDRIVAGTRAAEAALEMLVLAKLI